MNDDITIIVETGEQLPSEMRDEVVNEFAMVTPMFDGVTVVDLGEV
jgi:hypothetical protein